MPTPVARQDSRLRRGSVEPPVSLPAAHTTCSSAGPASRRWSLPVLAALFFVSGISALIYQVLWLRMLALIFGVTVHAAGAVLASFMAGLALGNYGGGRVADRARRPLLMFGGVEVMIGVCALVTPAALELVKRLYVGLHEVLGDGLPLLTIARLLFTFMVLLVPTALIGATLPLLVRSLAASGKRFGTHVSLLYGTNTAGAVAGVLLAGFTLIPNLGIAASFWVGALLNGAVGVAAIVMGLALESPRSLIATKPPLADPLPSSITHATPGLAISDGTRRFVLLVFGLSGFASLALEVIWFRVLVIFLGPTTYAFSIMLATVLAGIALGSALVTPWFTRHIDWLAVLAVVQVGIAVSALLSFWALSFMPPAAAYVEASAQTPSGIEYLGPVIIGSVLAILPASLLLGVAFPIGARLWADDDADGHQVAGRVGIFCAVNVCGAIVGPLAAAFWLLPALGSRRSLISIGGVAMASAFLLLIRLAHRRPRFAVATAMAGAIAFVVAAGRVGPAFDLALARVYGSEQLLWHEEGVQTTVKVNARRGPDGRPMRILYVDGWHQANDSGATLFLDRLIGVLPMALHQDPRRALVIGLGGGATPGAIARFPGTHVTVVELSPSVVRAANRWFAHTNFDLLQRPNATLRIDDGRNYLLLTDERYDVITADVIVPRHSGSANLYSTEYFELTRRALAPGGLMLQWIPDDTDLEYRTIMRTFVGVFPNATLWANGSLLVGSQGPLHISRAGFERRLADWPTRVSLELAGISSFEMLLLLYDAGPDELRKYVGSGPILTDDRPVVEYFLSSQHERRVVEAAELKGDVMRHIRP